jgi:hypothetical protein
MDWKKLKAAIDEIHRQAALAKDQEPDDFNYEMVRQLDGCAQRALYMLTRGACGEPCHFKLEVA